MGDVKRYNPDKLGGAGQMLQRHNGKWISYDDYAALEAQLARVKAEADYDRRQAEHLRTVVDRLNAEVTRLTAQLAAARRDALEEAALVANGHDFEFISRTPADITARVIAKQIRALIAQEDATP